MGYRDRLSSSQCRNGGEHVLIKAKEIAGVDKNKAQQWCQARVAYDNLACISCEAHGCVVLPS